MHFFNPSVVVVVVLSGFVWSTPITTTTTTTAVVNTTTTTTTTTTLSTTTSTQTQTQKRPCPKIKKVVRCKKGWHVGDISPKGTRCPHAGCIKDKKDTVEEGTVGEEEGTGTGTVEEEEGTVKEEVTVTEENTATSLKEEEDLVEQEDDDGSSLTCTPTDSTCLSNNKGKKKKRRCPKEKKVIHCKKGYHVGEVTPRGSKCPRNGCVKNKNKKRKDVVEEGEGTTSEGGGEEVEDQMEDQKVVEVGMEDQKEVEEEEEVTSILKEEEERGCPKNKHVVHCNKGWHVGITSPPGAKCPHAGCIKDKEVKVEDVKEVKEVEEEGRRGILLLEK